jgi:competence protein ComEC
MIGFLAGDMLIQQLAELPSILFLSLLTTVCAVAWLKFRYHWRYIHFFLAFLLGLTYTTWYTERILRWTLPHDKEEVALQVIGDVVSIPVISHHQAQFQFHFLKQNTKIKLSWNEPPPYLRVGDRWQLWVKLKRIHGLHNPGGFDYEAWTLQQGLRASGSVISTLPPIKITHLWYTHPINQLRQHIQAKLKQHLPNTATAHWLEALAIGERTDVPQDQWQVLRQTGTNHLMAIGGLHIGMVSGFVYLLVSWCWRRIPMLTLWLPAQEASACVALLAGWLYGALSGFAMPAQRACLMLTVYTIATLSRKKILSWHVWAMAMFVVLLVNPLSVLSDSFWLSFGTIALIIYGMSGKLSAHNFWWKWGRVQWVIGFGLLPLSLLFFQECSLASFLANSVAIPWLGCLILPFCLLGTMLIFILPSVGHLILLTADISFGWLWYILEEISHWSLSTWSQAMPNYFILLLSIIGILILITPVKFPARWLGIIWLLPLILFKPIPLQSGQAKVTMLDVGQGLSTVIQTQHHVLIFDAGPRNANVVVPFLRSQYINHIDKLVISHGDEDHIGGSGDILKSLPIKNITTSVPEKFTQQTADICLAGEQWQWDGVSFRFIYPYSDTLHLGNDSSCVLRIDAGQDRVLIPGDIEKFAEQTMVEREPDALRATVLIAPHHGSHTSSTPGFVNAVYPRYVWYAVGYRNRYHFPHVDVIERYRELNTEEFDSVNAGAISLIIGGLNSIDQNMIIMYNSRSILS